MNNHPHHLTDHHNQNGFPMHTTDITTTPATADNAVQSAAADPSGKPGWPLWTVQTLAWLNKTGKDVKRFVATDPAGAATLAGTAIGAVLTVLLAFVVFVKFLAWLVNGQPAENIAQLLPAVRIATDPIGHWLAAHTAGLPMSTPAAAWTWGATGFLLFYAAACRHLGAQLLWPLYGAATAAMAWFGTATPAHRPVAVGLLGVAWAVLSLLALRGRRTRRPRRWPSYRRPSPADGQPSNVRGQRRAAGVGGAK